MQNTPFFNKAKMPNTLTQWSPELWHQVISQVIYWRHITPLAYDVNYFKRSYKIFTNLQLRMIILLCTVLCEHYSMGRQDWKYWHNCEWFDIPNMVHDPHRISWGTDNFRKNYQLSQILRYPECTSQESTNFPNSRSHIQL